MWCLSSESCDAHVIFIVLIILNQNNSSISSLMTRAGLDCVCGELIGWLWFAIG